jgi:beta-glucosidase
MRYAGPTSLAAFLCILNASYAQTATSPDPDTRAAAVERRLTDAERFQLLHGVVPIPRGMTVAIPPGPALSEGVRITDIAPFLPTPPLPDGVKFTAGYIKGVARLNIPDILETDASLGVVNPMQMRTGDVATAMPSGLALASSFDPDLAFQGGATIGAEARAKGFNVLLGGGVNLARDPRNGRNFEYLGEDPLLAGTMAGAAIAGTQTQGVISTVKHFPVNDQETLRQTLNAQIDEAALRESDLLAFELAIERGAPGAVMCSYSRVNGDYACGNDFLLNQVLKRDWGYQGWVMSDWGAVHDSSYFMKGLDQESGAQLDSKIWFDAPLQTEVATERVSRGSVSEAARRILRSLYAVGADRPATTSTVDYRAHARVARQEAVEGMVLLKNDGVLPLSLETKKLLVIGGHADLGVLSGGGSSQVTPFGGAPIIIPVGAPGGIGMLVRAWYMPSSPLKALQAAMPNAKVEFQSGYDIASTAASAAEADVVIVFATQWQMEGYDHASLDLPEGQDALITAVTKENSNVVVVLETGNPVKMPWLGDVRAVLEAWYPGEEGGAAIVDVLSGAVNPSGHLPLSFPVDESQIPRSRIPGLGLPEGTPITVDYHEGADVGYRWFAAHHWKPLFPFGYGLSYTEFEFTRPQIGNHSKHGQPVSATFVVKNIGQRLGASVPQLYLLSAAGEPSRRLVSFTRLALDPGESRTIKVTLDSRLLAHWDSNQHRWSIAGGRYTFALGTSANELGDPVTIQIPPSTLKP